MLTPRNLKSLCLAGGGRLDAGVQFTYKGLKLELVDNFRYLGVIFSRSCSFDLCMCGHSNEKWTESNDGHAEQSAPFRWFGYRPQVQIV